MEFLQFLKDYWFLITLGISVLTAISYMVVFQVSPWEKYRETSERKAAVKLSIQLGQALLDAGHYKDAAGEFDHSLKLVPSNPDALEGKRKTDLFLRLEDPDWKPGRTMAYFDLLKDQNDHNILLFMGMLHLRIGEVEKSLQYYKDANAAYARKGNASKVYYYDALFQLGWSYYDKGDFNSMADYFRKMREMSPYDHRGYHGLGYALYMKAIAESKKDGKTAIQLLNEATQLLHTANNYVPKILVVNSDIGEIARIIDPDFSIFFHKRALDCLTDDKLFSLADNNGPVSAILITGDNIWVTLAEKEDKIAWINYQLALDHYIKALLKNKDAPDMEKHDSYFKSAQSVQKGTAPEKIYRDQKTIGDRLLKCIQYKR
ncbi:tetratricopeptide repeat protein [Nitrospira defluvii]|nr:tetratricopeptide repeat protein [Nitrospira defluvii]